MLEGHSIVCLDLETLYASTDCQWCGQAEETHGEHVLTGTPQVCRSDWEVPVGLPLPQYTPIGWHNKPALGLSIGCYFAYADMQYHFFDVYTLEATVRRFVTEQPLLVGFNSIGLDYVVMRGLLRRLADGHTQEENSAPPSEIWAQDLRATCDLFKVQCATSYDILAQIWIASPETKQVKGLNTLDAITQANGMPPKVSGGALIPQWWREGRYADVLEHVVDDVRKTKALFELIMRGAPLARQDGSQLLLPPPAMPDLEALHSVFQTQSQPGC
jgi:hypothetical protein